MAVTYAVTATKNNRLSMALLAAAVTPAAATSVDANASGNGYLIIGTSALSGATGVLAAIVLQKPSFTLSGGVATLAGVPLSATASAGGTAAKAEIRDFANTVIISGLTVGTSGSDINLNSTTISTSQTVTISSGTITHS